MLLHIFLATLWIALTIAALYGYKQRMRIAHLTKTSFPNQNLKSYKWNYIISAVALLLGYALLLAWLLILPENTEDNTPPKNDYVFVLDISNSMNACDMENNSSRLNAAKRAIADIMYQFENSDKIALVAFAGQAQTIVPLTNDKEYFSQALTALNTTYISQQSTNMQTALDAGIATFKANATQTESNTIKKIIILTDGENHYGNLNEFKATFEKQQIKMFAIGIGTEHGSTIEVSNGAQRREFLKDISGRDVVTKLNTDILKMLSDNYFLYPISFDNIKAITGN